MTRITTAMSILTLMNIGCVAITPIAPVPPEGQPPSAPAPQTIDSAPANAPTLALIGDSFATDMLADVSHNAPIPDAVAASLSADFLTWKLTQKPIDTNTKMAVYTRNMAYSPLVGTSSWSVSSRLNKSTIHRTSNVVRQGMLASDIAKGDVPLAAPSSRAVFLNIGADDFCKGTALDDFAKQYELAATRVLESHTQATIVLLPVLNLNAIAEALPSSKTVTGFAGVTPTCKDMRDLFQSCPALSQQSRSLGDIAAMNAVIEKTATNLAASKQRNVKFLNWNVENPTGSIDCTHADASTLQRMADVAWAETQSLLTK